MADKKISELTASATPLTGSDVFPVSHSGSTLQATLDQIASYAQNIGSGDGPDPITFGPALAQLFNIRSGTSAVPNTTEKPVVNITLTQNIAAAAHPLAPGYGAAVSVELSSIANNSTQPVAINALSVGYADSGLYAIGAYGMGWHSSGLGGGMGVFAQARTDVSTGGAVALGTTVENNSGQDSAYAASGSVLHAGVDLAYSSSPAKYGGAAALIRAASGTWDVGVGIQALSVRSAGVRDDSSSVTSIDIRGSHTTGIDFSNGSFSGGYMKMPAWTTYSPTITAGAGAFTTVSGAGRYLIIGKTMFLTVTVTVTTNNTAATSTLIPLPTGTAIANAACGSGRENALSGKQLQVRCAAGSGTLTVVDYANAYAGGDGASLLIFAMLELT